jgi:hypothetical protein
MKEHLKISQIFNQKRISPLYVIVELSKFRTKEEYYKWQGMGMWCKHVIPGI